MGTVREIRGKSHHLEESVLRVEPHDGVVVEVLGQRQLVDLERPLELAHDAPVVLELLLGLLAAVQLERLQPLCEALELTLRLQLVREDLRTRERTENPGSANFATLFSGKS